MKLLVGYDGSNSAKAALELACVHAKAFDASIEVVASLEGGSVTEAVEVQHAKEDLEFAENHIAKNKVLQ
jgi:nucleotide-binding universal stress UspA family protein